MLWFPWCSPISRSQKPRQLGSDNGRAVVWREGAVTFMTNWKPLLGRITFLTSVPSVGNGTGLSALDLYKAVWQADPDNFQKQAPGVFPLSSQAQGNINSLSVKCSVQPIRIDFTIAPIQSSAILKSIPLIDDPEKLKPEFARIIKALDHNKLKIVATRVACFVQLAHLISNFVDANKIITSILPEAYRLTLSGEEDFVLQINHPRQSGFSPQLQMNFVTQWATNRLNLLTLLQGPTPIVD
jgi:hypothetical protein